MGTWPLALAFCVVAMLSFATHTNAQTVVPIDVESMLENTGIVAPMFCNAPLNQYQMVLVNGLSYTTQATLVLQCTGCDNTTVLVDLAALKTSGVLTIAAPVSCLVTNRYCRVLMYVENALVGEGLPPEQVLVSQVESTCGVVPPNDYTAGCGWIDFACQMTNGEWYHYGPALCLYLAFVFIVLLLGVVVMLLLEHNSHQFRLANVAKSLTGNAGIAAMTFMEGANMQFQTNTMYPLQARPAGFFSPPNTAAATAAKGGAMMSGSSASSMKHRPNATGKGNSARPRVVHVSSLLQNINDAPGQ